MGNKFGVIALAVFTFASACAARSNAGTEIVRDYSAQAPVYNYTPPPPPTVTTRLHRCAWSWFRAIAITLHRCAFMPTAESSGHAFIPPLMAGDKSMARKSDALAFNLQIVNL